MNDIFQKLNKLIVLQSAIIKSDEWGGQNKVWQDFCETFAMVEQINNLSPQIRSKNFANNFYKFTVRSQHKIIRGMRVVKDSEYYEIEAVNICKINSAYNELITIKKVANDLSS